MLAGYLISLQHSRTIIGGNIALNQNVLYSSVGDDVESRALM